MFSSRHESLTDLIVGFFVQWLMAYLVMYPFAGVYFLGWSTPRSLWAYSSSWTDLFVGVLVWIISFVVFLIPPALIIGALYLLLRGRFDREMMRDPSQRGRAGAAAQQPFARGIDDKKYR